MGRFVQSPSNFSPLRVSPREFFGTGEILQGQVESTEVLSSLCPAQESLQLEPVSGHGRRDDGGRAPLLCSVVVRLPQEGTSRQVQAAGATELRGRSVQGLTLRNTDQNSTV